MIEPLLTRLAHIVADTCSRDLTPGELAQTNHVRNDNYVDFDAIEAALFTALSLGGGIAVDADQRRLIAIGAGQRVASEVDGWLLAHGVERDSWATTIRLSLIVAAMATAYLDLSRTMVANALAIAGALAPVGLTTVGGGAAEFLAQRAAWSMFVGASAARLAADGLVGPPDLFEAPRDGLAALLADASQHQADARIPPATSKASAVRRRYQRWTRANLFTRQLAELVDWATGLRAVEVMPAARAAARRLLIDRVGIALGGVRLGEVGVGLTAARQAGAAPVATRLGSAERLAAPWAAFANGCAGDSLELAVGPDCVEAGLAAAEIADASIGDLLVSIVAAVEVGAWLRDQFGESLEQSGRHPPAALGAVSATVAACRLLGLSTEACRAAVWTAANVSPAAPFAPFSVGASSKLLYGGWPSLVGLSAALGGVALGQSPLGPLVLRRQDLGGSDTYSNWPGGSPAPFTPFAGGVAAVERVMYKPFPCSRSAQAALTALERLGQIDAAAVEQVWLGTYPYAVELSRRVRGDNPIAATMNLRLIMALYLVFGGLEPGVAFAPARIADPRVQDLAGRIAVDVAPEFARPGPRVRGAIVELKLRSGGRLREQVEESRWGAGQRATTDEIMARAAALAGRDLSQWRAAELTPVRAILAREFASHSS